MADRTLSRRRLSQLLSTVGLAAVAIPVAGRRLHAEEQAVYFTWSVYNDPDFFPDYVKKHGANPDVVTLTGEEKDLQKLRGSLIVDVAHPCNSSVGHWYEAGFLQPIDTSRLSHWPDLFEALKTLKDARQNGQQYFVPIDWGYKSIIYRTDLVHLEEQSWTLLWDEKYKGKLSVSRSAEETCVIAAIVAGAQDPFNMTDAEIAKVKDLLNKQKPLLRFYWDTNKTVEEGLAAGELVAATAWNTSIAAVRKKGVRVKLMQPKEGILMYCCGLVLAKSAPHLDQAYDLLDALTAPDAGKWLIEQQGYGHSNRKSFDVADDDKLAYHGLPKNPAVLLSTAILLQRNARSSDLNWMFEEVKSGL